MAKCTPRIPTFRWRRSFLLAALLLITLAWGAAATGCYRANNLDLPPLVDADIPERLRRDGYLLRQMQPYALVAVGLEILAFLLLRSAIGAKDRFGLLGGLVSLGLVISVVSHGLWLWLIWMFAQSHG